MGFVKQHVESLSAALGEPQWVLERRLEAWKIFEDLDIPGEKHEQWRYTDFRRLRFDLDSFTAAIPATTGAPRDLPPELAAKGVIWTDIHTAIAEHEDLVGEHLFTQLDPDAHIFAALHAALFSSGEFVYVPAGVEVEHPLTASFELDQVGSAIFPHTLIVLEEGAALTYLQREGSNVPGMADAGVEISVGPRANLSFVSLQEFDEAVWHFERIGASCGRDSVIRSTVVSLGGRFSRTEATTAMRGDHADVEMLGLYFASRGQHFDFRTLQDHAARDCRSDLLYKGALQDDSRAVYAGVIRVQPNAAGTDAYQTNRNLILSDNAKADSKPELEIENNDVKCSHGASVGQINESELFYLMSRGIPRPEAERLIVKGFFEEVMGRVANKDIAGLLASAIEGKMTS